MLRCSQRFFQHHTGGTCHARFHLADRWVTEAQALQIFQHDRVTSEVDLKPHGGLNDLKKDV